MSMHASPQHYFAENPSVSLNRSSFERPHEWRATVTTDYLIPFFLDEVLPGDTFNLDHSIYTRLIAPIDVPMMDNLHMDTFYFFVPLRLIWDNSKRFFGEKRKPSDSTDFTVPVINIDQSIEINSIYDYFGIPYGVSNFSINALPLRAYNLIYNEWFRSEQLIDWVDFNTGDGPDDMTDYTLLRRGKRFDYFTSALAQPTDGDPVTVSFTGDAPVVGTGSVLGLDAGTYGSTALGYTSHNTIGLTPRFSQLSNVPGVSITASQVFEHGDPSPSTNIGLGVSSDSSLSGLKADLSTVSVLAVQDLAEAFQVANFNINTARSGNRYTEILYGHFGVISPDSSLQRPEYLGGSHDRLTVSVVTQSTPGNTLDNSLGKLSAVISGVGNTQGFTKSFTEHGLILGFVNIYADLSYQQGLNRMWSRRTKFDYYWPEFANLYDQTILNKEIYLQGTDEDDDVFGYAERYAEYKYFPNIICGELRSTYAQSLDSWHLAEHFENLPVLGQEFIENHTPIERLTAVTDKPSFVMDVNFQCNCIRPMPLYNDPSKWYKRA